MAGTQHAEPPIRPCVPGGTRVYAIGDIHGRRDLLVDLLRRIEMDAETAPTRRVLVFLGDYIDRGPDSAGVLARLAQGPPNGFDMVCLKGNHEDMMDRFLAGDPAAAAHWLANGGWETLQSFGLDTAEPGALADALSPAQTTFLAGLITLHREGDYVFVHAGVAPGTPLSRQDDRDLMWIRGRFLDANTPFGAFVVHGHTITREPDVTEHRIGIDTGAYHTNRLTALVLEGADRRFLFTRTS